MSAILDYTATGMGMTVAEMEGMVQRELPPNSVGSKEIKDLLNEGMNEISRMYGIPKKVLIASSIPAGGRIGLGVQVQSHKGLTITDSNGMSYSIYSAQEAASIRPKWLSETTGGYAVLDLASPSAMADGELYIRPYVEDTSLELTLAVSIKPLPLLNDGDQPFAVEIEGERSDGAIPEHHIALVHFALFRLFKRMAVKAEEEFKWKAYSQEASMYYAAYEKAKSEIFEYSDPPFIFPKVRKV
jgi:hypothetical protein